MTEQIWHTMIVRVWRDHDGLKIRFTVEDQQQPPRSVAVESSIEAACRQFGDWLRSVDTRADDGQETGEQTAAP